MDSRNCLVDAVEGGKGSMGGSLFCPFSSPPFEGNSLGLGFCLFAFFPLLLLSLISLLQALVHFFFFLVCFPEAAPGWGRAGDYRASAVTCTGREAGIAAADVEFCLAGGSSGHSLSSLGDWAANQSCGWLFSVLTLE